MLNIILASIISPLAFYIALDHAASGDYLSCAFMLAIGIYTAGIAALELVK